MMSTFKHLSFETTTHTDTQTDIHTHTTKNQNNHAISSWNFEISPVGDRSHDKHLADIMRDLLFLMKRFGFGAATPQNSGLHFLIARSIDLHIIRGVIRASSSTASLHSLHKPKGSCFLLSFLLVKSV